MGILPSANALDSELPATARIPPDPTTGTAGQVVAVNTGATAFELVDQTGGMGGGSTTYLGLTDTPSAFGTAGQVVTVNTGGDALVFADAGSGGTGDITAVNTANNSGLAGGVTTGAANLSLDIANLQTAGGSPSTTDQIALVQDVTNSSETRKVTVDSLFTTFASTGIGALAGGAPLLRPDRDCGHLRFLAPGDDNLYHRRCRVTRMNARTDGTQLA